MSPENRRANLRDEWALSTEAWLTGELALASNKEVYRSAVNRFYYCCLHAARAALLTEGLEPKSHGGVRAEFHRRFVQTGKIPHPIARVLGDLQSQRESADYDRTVSFSREDAEYARTSASEFRNALERMLTDEQWLCSGSDGPAGA